MSDNRIISVEIKNILRISAFYLEPVGPVVVLGGDNEQGKTSVLEALAIALGGGKLPEVPVHRGADKGYIVIKTPKYVIRKDITKEGKSQLVITNAEGDQRFGSPQTLLDAVVGDLGFDPLKFYDLGKTAEGRKKQMEMLRELIGLDTTEIDRKRKALYDGRALAGRDVTGRQTQIDAMPFHADAPDKEVSVADLAAKVDEISRFNSEQDAAEQKKELWRSRIDAVDEEIANADREIEKLTKHRNERAEYKGRLVADEAALPAPKQKLDAEPIRQQITEAEAVNRKVRQNASRAAMQAQFQAAKEQYAEFDRQIEELDAARRSMIAAAKFPIEGLALGESCVEYKGLPLNQASSAEAWQVCIAIAAAMSKGLKLMCIRNASLLDDKHLAVVYDMAQKLDLIVWMERVGEGKEVTVVIEDGTVKKAVES